MTEGDVTDQLTPLEVQELQTYLSGNSPEPEQKHNTHTFLHRVATSIDTTKTAYLTDEEIGIPLHPVRTIKSLALIADKIVDNPFFREYFEAESEIVTASSLSRDAKLINLSVIQRRQLEDVTKKQKENKGWFKKKNKSTETES